MWDGANSKGNDEMMSGLARGLRKWGVTTTGLLLVACGASAMWNGWDQILIERGWSLFIAGATLIAGGAITASIGIMLAHFDAWARKDAAASAATATPPNAAQMAARRALAGRLAEKSSALEAEGEAGAAPAVKTSSEGSEPAIIDSYESGGAAYVMYSDGSVEVRTEFGTQRYASVAELRADMDS
jgi:hypothetical protein